MELTPIAFIQTPFKQKLGIPKQPSLAKHAKGVIKLLPEFQQEGIFREIETFERLWLLFAFHKHENWRPTISPPALKGEKRVGVFASRSPHRPNPLGLSSVKLEKKLGDFEIQVQEVDLLNQTPIYDIKPYLPQWDAFSKSSTGWTQTPQDTQKIKVVFADHLKSWQDSNAELKELLIESLQWDARPLGGPAHKVYKHHWDTWEISWQIPSNAHEVRVLDIQPFSSS